MSLGMEQRVAKGWGGIVTSILIQWGAGYFATVLSWMSTPKGYRTDLVSWWRGLLQTFYKWASLDIVVTFKLLRGWAKGKAW